jgi:hypothetical protein
MLAFKIKHLFATFGAAQACFQALLHVLADVLAALRARTADFSASGAQLCVHFESGQHRVGGRPANLGAVQHQSEVRRLGVFAALLQTMSHRHVQTDAMAMLAIINARAHFLMHRIIGRELLFHDYLL